MRLRPPSNLPGREKVISIQAERESWFESGQTVSLHGRGIKISHLAEGKWHNHRGHGNQDEAERPAEYGGAECREYVTRMIDGSTLDMVDPVQRHNIAADGEKHGDSRTTTVKQPVLDTGGHEWNVRVECPCPETLSYPKITIGGRCALKTKTASRPRRPSRYAIRDRTMITRRKPKYLRSSHLCTDYPAAIFLVGPSHLLFRP